MNEQKSYQRIILPLCFSIVIVTMSYGLVIPALASLFLGSNSNMLDQNMTVFMRNSFYTCALSLPMIFMFFGAPLLGAWSDRIGRKKALILALLGISLSCLLSAYGVVIGSVMFLLLGRALLGLMDGSISIAQAAIADISKNADKVTNLGLISLAGSLGFAIGPSLGGYLSYHFCNSWMRHTVPFIFAAFLAFINAVWLLFLFKEKYNNNEQPLNGFQHQMLIFKDKKVQWLSITFFLLQLSWGTYFQSVPILLTNFLFAPNEIGLFMSLIALCFSLTSLCVMRILIKFCERRRIIKLGLSFIAAGAMILFFLPQKGITWFSVIPITLGVGMSYNTLLSLLSDTVGKNKQGNIMGMSTSLVALAWLSAALLSSVLSTIYIKLPYLMVGIVALLNFCFLNRSQFYLSSQPRLLN